MRTIVTYVPHGIDTKMFYPITPEDKHWNLLQTEFARIRSNKMSKFVVMWNNRNIHRKHPGDVILAYKHLCDKINANGGNAAEECILLMHTTPIDPNGTDLTAVVNRLCPEYPVMFSDKVISSEQLNILYNAADVTFNMASNEGFGLSTAESLAAGTPIVVNVTGGLQDQCGFINPKTGNYFTPDDYIEVQTLHRAEQWDHLNHGRWVKPVWASNISLQGSVPTPYIFDERCRYEDVGDALYEWYCIPPHDREEAGAAGREFIMNPEVGMSRDLMCERVIQSIENTITNFQPRNRFELITA